MPTSFSTFLVQTGRPLRFESYLGPPTPKPRSKGGNTKTTPSLSDEWPDVEDILKNALASEPSSKTRGIVTCDTGTMEGGNLICLDGEVSNENCSRGGEEGDVGDSVDDISIPDERPSVASNQSGLLRGPCIEGSDESSTGPLTADGSTRENAVVIHDDQAELETDTNDEEDHCPLEDNAGTLAQEHPSNEHLPTGMQDVVDSDMIEVAEAPANAIPLREPTTTPSRSTVNHAPTSCDSGAKKTVTFTDAALLEKHGADHTPGPQDTVPEINGNARRRSSHLTRVTGDHTVLPRKKTKKRTKMLGQRAITRTSRSSSSNSVESDSSHDSTRYNVLPTHKRKRSSKTTKQCTSYRSAPGARHSGYETMVLKEDSSSDTSSEQSDDSRHYLRATRRPKSTASLSHLRKQEISHKRGSPQPSRNIARSVDPSLTSHTYAAMGKTPSLSAGSITPRLVDIAIHPLSPTTAFSTALFRDCNDTELFSSNKAVGLLQNHLGNLIKPGSITMKPVTPGMWFLTYFLSYPFCHDTHWCDQPAPVSHPLPSDNVDSGGLSDGDDGKDHDGSFTDSDNDDSGNNGHLSNRHKGPSRSRQGNRWSPEEDDYVIKWKRKGKNNEWISSQLQGRSPGAVHIRWYTKLRGR